MHPDGSPSYQSLFADRETDPGDEARAVYSPAAYLADLLQLLGTEDGGAAPALVARRPDLEAVPLDAGTTAAELPYLDIVNAVLADDVRRTDAVTDPYAFLAELPYPLSLPFDLGHQRVRRVLAHLGVDPVELYRLFAPEPDPDVVARERLGLTTTDVTLLTTAPDEAGLRTVYRLADGEQLAVLEDADRFLRVTGLTAEELAVVLAPVTLDVDARRLRHPAGTDPAGWYARVSRFTRLARKTGFGFADLDLVLRSCCGNRIDLPAVRTLAALTELRTALGLPVDVLVSLVAPVATIAVPGSGDPLDLTALSCTGDPLAERNARFRRDVTTALGLSAADLAAIVGWYRRRDTGEPGPFDRGRVELPAVALLHRVVRLARALAVPVPELLEVVDALDADPSARRWLPFPIVLPAGVGADPLDTVLAGGDPGTGLWLVQTLVATVRWMQGTGVDAAALRSFLGGTGGAADTGALVAALRERFEEVELGPDAFLSSRFGERAAQVIDSVLSADTAGVVSPLDSRLLRVDPARAEATAHLAVSRLGVVTADDFVDLGLDARLNEKLFTNLVLGGHLDADGTVVAGSLPTDPVPLRLARDFGGHRDAVFDLVAECARTDGDGPPESPPAFFPSDLAAGLPELTDDERTELYDNLVVNGHLDADGAIVDPGFFGMPGNVAAFAVDVDLSGLAAGVLDVLRRKVAAFGAGRVRFAMPDLGLTPAQQADLVASLRFNGHLAADGTYADPATLVDLPVAGFELALELYPVRRRVLDALKDQLVAARSELLAVAPEDFAAVVDPELARRVIARLTGPRLVDGRVPEEQLGFYADPANVLEIDGFPAADAAVVFDRIGSILAAAEPYRFDRMALVELEFDAGERESLVGLLIGLGHLTADLTIPQPRLAYFDRLHNSLTFALPGFDDYARDVFFLLRGVAQETSAAVAEITGVLDGVAAAQRDLLHAVLQDELGLPAAVVEAITTAIAGAPPAAVEQIVAPALGGGDDPGLHRALGRISAFSRLATALGLDPAAAAVAFADQQLAGKFPEPLALPAGVDRIDALLEGADGTVSVFAGAGCWRYAAGSHALLPDQPTPLAALSPRFETLTRVDAAFTDATGTEWLVGTDTRGASRAFTRAPGGARWAPRDQVWGAMVNAFAGADRIDAAYADENGRTYLFRDGQYVRYSTNDFRVVDEGYPRRVGAFWEAEYGTAALPPAFRRRIDAAFADRDGTAYLFSGQRFLAVGPSDPDGDDGPRATDQPIAGSWGRVRNELAGADRVAAAYATGGVQFVFSGDQLHRFSDSLDTSGRYADDSFPRLVSDAITGLPPEFGSGVQAAFSDPAGRLHLFKDGRTVTLGPDSDGAIVPTASRWGVLGPVLPSETVDAALVGLDGRTYVFSGGRFLRYSRADYSVADLGYPRDVADTWGGLRRVDAAFVLDGATHLFGSAGRLFTDAPELASVHATELDAGRLPRTLRRRLLEHGVTPIEEKPVTGSRPEWTVAAEGGIAVLLRRVAVGAGGPDTQIVATVDPASDARFAVRYSTRDYSTPDPGYPRPLGDNWWNLPDGLVGAGASFDRIDAVLTGRDGRTYLFAGDQMVVSDTQRRWWSAPRPISAEWQGLPFARVDAAFLGRDDKTYLFGGGSYVRYSGDDHSAVDDRYPADILPFWGNVANTIARTGVVDAALVLDEHTYLFSGDQYVRYTGTGYATVDAGYPRSLAELPGEPRLANLTTRLDGVDAALADRRTVHLFRGDRRVSVSDAAYRRYDDLGLDGVTCAFLDDGRVVVEHGGQWCHHTALEGVAHDAFPVRPRLLRRLPEQFRTGLDAVLAGTDGATYVFRGSTCFNVTLDRAYPLGAEWGRPRNAVYHDNVVDAAFVGTDGRTYVFSGEEFLVYSGTDYALADGEARPIAEHWGGLANVTLAFVRDGRTYVIEAPDATGTSRCVTYSGDGYAAPDAAGPWTVDASFWQIPPAYRPAGFTIPDAVLFDGDSTLLVVGAEVIANDANGTWIYPRPLERVWPGLGRPDGLSAAFTGRDGATHFFLAGEYARVSGGAVAPREQIRDRWGRTPGNTTLPGGTVDAAVVAPDGATYLFSGDQYVRYSGADYRYADPGYPKPIAGSLRTEQPFTALPVAFDEELAERAAAGARSLVDAAVADDRTVFLICGGICHAVSGTLTAEAGLDSLRRVRNVLDQRGRVDAALSVDGRTYLFAGDQYVRYSGADRTWVDPGYPREIGDATLGLAGELGIAELPAEFVDGLDAAFRSGTGDTHLFAGRNHLRIGRSGQLQRGELAEWGVVRNELGAGAPPRAAFTAPTGEVYVFGTDQYVRYAPGRFDTIEEGFPRTIAGDFGALPGHFATGIDAAFVLGGRTYLGRQDEYVRYSGPLDEPDPTFPQPYRFRFGAAADYRLRDVVAIARFAALDRAGGLAAFLAPGAAPVADPYAHLAGLLDWDADELRWCRRHSTMLTGTADDGDRLELAFVLGAADAMRLGGLLGTGPSRVHSDVWSPLRGGKLAGAADALTVLLADRWGAAGEGTPIRQLRDELNEAVRDALVAAVLGRGKGPAPDLTTPSDLYERFLLDPATGAQGSTSRVREAIAATQLFVQRFLRNLEPDAGSEDVRRQVRSWWSWMRNYRVWEANRKVFLYPENYLRPELRATKTPAFTALENDLLQGEITAASVEQSYKRYLDEYTEVSRLTIAGGYVYTKDQDPAGPRRLVLFGRTKTDPRRYFYRRAEFASREKQSATWEAWQPVDVRIDADLVSPVHAFGRVFVFWAVTEAVPADEAGSSTTVVVKDTADGQQVSGPPKAQRVTVYYSFYNLNKEWVPAQLLGSGGKELGVVSGITLLVRPRVKPDTGRTSVLVAGGYSVTGADGKKADRSVLIDLNPELYADDLLDGPLRPDEKAILADLRSHSVESATAARVSSIFAEPVAPGAVVRFDHPAGSETWPWFSVDHKGGSFLVRPVVPGAAGGRLTLAGNSDRLPQTAVDAAVELPAGTRLFFSGAGYSTAAPGGTPGTPVPIVPRWGRRRGMWPAQAGVSAILTRGTTTYVFSGGQYVTFSGTPFLWPDADPKSLAGNTERFPQLPDWPQIDVAFVGRDGIEYFFCRDRHQFVTSDDLTHPRSDQDHWSSVPGPNGMRGVDAALVTDTATFIVSGRRYARWTDPDTGGGKGKGKNKPAYGPPDPGYPRLIAGNPDGLPTDMDLGPSTWRAGTAYWVNRATGETYQEISATGKVATHAVAPAVPAVFTEQRVDTAWVASNKLYLTRGTSLVRYSLGANDSIPDLVDEGYPRTLTWTLEAAFTRDSTVYLFSGGNYAKIGTGAEPDAAPVLPIAAAWGDLGTGTPPFDAALDTDAALYLIAGTEYVRYPATATVRRPYELATLPFEIVRLTTGTAADLNQKLLGGGVDALLDLATQETDEVTVGTDRSSTVVVNAAMVDAGRLPTGSHLDFRSANGLYYWEIFFHAPMLVAGALTAAQRFEDAQRWYEYVFDPTDPDSYWRFLPFLSIDLAALADGIAGALAETRRLRLRQDDLALALAPVLTALRTLAPAAMQSREPVTEAELAALSTVATAMAPRSTVLRLTDDLVRRRDLTAKQRAAVTTLAERVAMLGGLEKQFDAIGDRDSLLAAYRDDPLDPHAIADLRPVAYRRAVVMAYVENLIGWGDMLFRQYTAESVDEARMLYVLAWDLLGHPPERLGLAIAPAPQTFGQLDAAPGDLDLIGELTSAGAMTEDSVHASVADRYFVVPENGALDEFRARIADRLGKIRASQDILGTGAPLPLFSPPADPLALVAAAGGGGLDSAVAAATPVPVPAYRFSFLLRRAQELTDKLKQFGTDLLGVLERRDAEQLTVLQGKQEAAILALTRGVREAQVLAAEQTVAELTAGKVAAQDRVTYYEQLIATGVTPLEQAQLGLMASAATAHMTASVLKLASAIAHIAPQVGIGPFILGVEEGGEQAGESIDKVSEFSESLGEGLSVLGEVLGVRAEQLRQAGDWQLQLTNSTNEVTQIGYQIESANQQLAAARQEAAILEAQIAHNRTVSEFLRSKFATADLYGWLAGQLSELYFRAYHQAYETARAAERAFQFENGVDTTYIRPSYWDSRRAGLLAGESLGLDLDQLARADAGDQRGLEITKKVSLLALDPAALLRLRAGGACEFTLSEAEFDHDFPGHFRRQLRSVAVTFLDESGRPTPVNATLTQLGHRTLLAADPAGVRHLLDPQGPPPATVRTDWRPSQRIALSQVDGGEDAGVFELRYDDDRYLPFEGTGAISTWRLERSGRSYAEPYDVVLTVRYTAEHGGDAFAKAVRGLLKPYTAARIFDLATDFPQEWADFTGNGTAELALPLTPELFPDMSSRQVSTVLVTYDLEAGGSAHFALSGAPDVPLGDRVLLATPGLTIGADAGSPLVLRVDGDKEAMRDARLVLTYQAKVR